LITSIMSRPDTKQPLEIQFIGMVRDKKRQGRTY